MQGPLIITAEEIDKSIKRGDEKKLLKMAEQVVANDCTDLDLFKEKIRKCDLITRAKILKYILDLMNERGL